MSDITEGPWLQGPWVVDTFEDRNVVGVADANGSPICELYHGVDGWTMPGLCTTREWKVSHARLIAASPELFSALQSMLLAGDDKEEMAARLLANKAIDKALGLTNG